ncbi:MAG: glycosyl hydrolase, partial [Armatimonadetes bacterium]|nr:glycosyl hydrolase [Armatimonadota bacterium]
VVWGIAPEKLLAESGIGPDFASRERLRSIHRRTADGADIYFVSNPQPYARTAMAAFRVTGKIPELWWPDTGRTETAAVFQEKEGATSVLLPLGPSGSVFVVFRQSAGQTDSIVAVKHQGTTLLALTTRPPHKITVDKAVYGILDDPARTRDVRDKAQRIVDGGESSFHVAAMAAGDDPAYGIVKTLVLEYTASISVTCR